MSNRLLLLCLAALSLAAQSKYEIRGRVLEVGTNHPIEGARVSVTDMQELIGENNPVVVMTDTQGEYRYTPRAASFYSVEVTKAKYAKGVPGSSTTMLARFDEKNPSRRLDFTMAPLTDLTVRVVDEDTNEPVAGLMVRLLRPVSINGELYTASPAQSMSGADGRVTWSVPPGTYAVLIPRPLPVERLQKTFTKEEAEAIDHGYGYRLFPGGPYMDTALPVEISAGASTDFGTIRLRKQPLYRVRVSTSGCDPGEVIYLRDVLDVGPLKDVANNLGEVPCGSEFLLKNMQAGRYMIQARNTKWAGNPEEAVGPGVRTAVVTFDTVEGNRNLALNLGSGITIEGRVAAAQGSSPVPMARFLMATANSSGIENRSPPRTPDGEGRFHWENLSPGPLRLTVTMGTDFYVKQVRVRGVPIRGLVFNMPESGEIEVEIDSNPASVSGTVRNGDKPVANADVALVSWPLVQSGDYSDDPSLVKHLKTDAEGNFRAAGLVPGEYRVFAVSDENLERSQFPNVWSRIVQSAERLILSRGAMSTIELKLTDPSR